MKYISIVILLFLSSCVDKEQMKKEILEDLSSEIYSFVEKGDGSNFYNESISIGGEEFFIHHSTLKCPAIEKGVQRNCWKTNGYNNTFCHICMNDELINIFNNKNFPKGYK